MNNLFPLVSIILPTYNRANLLPRAINSVLSQDYSNWELIVWDDGSTDNSEDVIRAFLDSRLKYFYAENHGAAYARNRCIEVAQGEYLAFLDSDDEWCSGKLELQIKTMLSFPEIDILFGDFINIDVISGEKHRTFDKYTGAMDALGKIQLQDDLYLIRTNMPEILTLGNFIAMDTVMMRKEVIKRTGYFAENLRRSEDFELWWRMGLDGVRFAYQNQVLLYRYKELDSLSHASIFFSKSTIDALNLCYQNAKQKKREDTLSYLNHPMRNAWQHLIILYGNKGNNRQMFNAFLQSLQYGFRLGSLRLLAKGLINQLIKFIKVWI